MRRIRFAVRALAHTPLLTLVVVLSLGLGIGANTAIFSLLYQMVLRSLPVQEPERLVTLTSHGEFKFGRSSSSDAGGQDMIFSYRVFRALEKNPQGMEGVAGFRGFSANLAYANQTTSGNVTLVSGGYFPLLRVQPLMGRLLSPGDDRDGAGNPVAVLSFGYWKDRLGGNSAALNQPIRVNGQIFTIVGITPKDFTGTVLGDEPQVYVPMAFKKEMTPGWDGREAFSDYWIYSFARLKPGVTREQAQAALNTVYAGVLEEQVKTVKGRDQKFLQRMAASRIALKDGNFGQSEIRQQASTPIYILMAATALVLLIAMANAANLMLARSAQRRRELAIRAALGAGRGDIMGQLLVEALLMAAAGGVAGILFGYWTVHAILGTLFDGETKVYGIGAGMDWPVLLFALGISVASGLFFGLYPAWEAARVSLANTLKDAAGQTTAGTGSARVRKVLVCAQVAISALLLIPTGLFLKSLVNILQVDLGLNTENVITFGISPELNGYKPEKSRVFFERLETELAGVPGVKNVTASMVPLIAGANWGNDVNAEGYPEGPDVDNNASFNIVGPGFFSKIGTPLIAGREFNDSDTLAGPKVAVVNEVFAKHFFGNQNPIGHYMGVSGNKKRDIQIVGVVKNSSYSRVKQEPPRLYFTPYRQSQDLGSIHYYVRTALPPQQVMPQVRRVVAAVDADLPVEEMRTFEDQVQSNIRPDRLVFQLAGTFAFLATLLAMLGLYGVMANSVTRRTREIGIRIALGAALGGIRGMVMREVLLILGAGLVVGVPAALGLATFTKSQLYGVKSFDLTVVAGAVLALAAAAIAAGYFPARRATRVNPLEALRYE